MKKYFSLLLALSLLMSYNLSAAETYTYPDSDNPVVQITFPDGWEIEPDEEMLHAMPNDESIYLGFLALEGSNDIEDALDAVDEVLAELLSELELADFEEIENDDFVFLYSEGNGVDKEGDDVNVTVALFSPDGEMVCLVFYYGTPEAEEIHENELNAIVASILKP